MTEAVEDLKHLESLDLEGLIADLQDLHKQATEERSHHYIGDRVKSAAAMLLIQAGAIRAQSSECERLRGLADSLRDMYSERSAELYRLKGLLEEAGKAIEACGGAEQPAFEEWAASHRYDMHEHPLHYIFMDPKTDAARQGWNAALAYARRALPTPSKDNQNAE